MDLKARGIGVLLVGLGTFLLKLSFFDVLRHAQAQASSVTTSYKALLVAPSFMLSGLLLVLMGAPGDGSAATGLGRHMVNPRDRKLTPLGWVFALSLLIPGVVLSLWLTNRLEELGY
ncbi:Hypothetical protein CAP_6782 [Chondromyces apiculatus DSM 436]|uniref:Uncharacterized protein n=2 Tax=Chondromyces apiculatus TaxID=51 RepID=A0A017T182_9BACT|nr:Hypothetical protein CAP_6782 [Chondromyces apiculatus DSM 436]